MNRLPTFLCTALTAALVACTAGSRQALDPSRDARAAAIAPSNAPLSPPDSAPREQTADQQIRHVLNRLAFGARPGDFESVRAMGVDTWIARQLSPGSLEDGVTDRYVAVHFPTVNMSATDVLARYPTPAEILLRRRMEQGADSAVSLTTEDSAAIRRAGVASRRVVTDVQSMKVVRALASDRQLQEVMVDFWENHFSVYAAKGPERYLLASYERDAIRPFALGNFRALLGAVAKSPAMLFYLDNWESSVERDRPALEASRVARARGVRAGGGRRGVMRSPEQAARPDSVLARLERRPKGLNENYGRELLELHTLGVDGGYTQQDVINAARALTGWSIEQPRRNPAFVFRPEMHDAGQKVILGHVLPAGRGLEDGEALLDIVARHPATAHFIATKLVRHFVSDSVPEALVRRVAATFQRTNGDIRQTLWTLFESAEFFSTAAYRAKVKSPFELVVSALRATGADPDSTPRTAQLIARLGQPIFGHQAPDGWPDVADAWINTGSILNRINFGLALAAGRVPGARVDSWTRAAALTHAPRAVQVDSVVHSLLGGEASPDTRRILLSGVNPLADQNDSGNAMVVQRNARSITGRTDMRAPATETDSLLAAADSISSAEPDAEDPGSRQRRGAQRAELLAPTDLHGVAQIVGLALGSPEFQRH